MLTYAAHTLKTIVANNAWVPLWERLTRLAKTMLRQWKEEWKRLPETTARNDRVTAYEIVNAIRVPAPQFDSIPEPARSWIEDVRPPFALDFSNSLLGVMKCDVVHQQHRP